MQAKSDNNIIGECYQYVTDDYDMCRKAMATLPHAQHIGSQIQVAVNAVIDCINHDGDIN
jgi:hypothetical protein